MENMTFLKGYLNINSSNFDLCLVINAKVCIYQKILLPLRYLLVDGIAYTVPLFL